MEYEFLNGTRQIVCPYFGGKSPVVIYDLTYLYKRDTTAANLQFDIFVIDPLDIPLHSHQCNDGPMPSPVEQYSCNFVPHHHMHHQSVRLKRC